MYLVEYGDGVLGIEDSDGGQSEEQGEDGDHGIPVLRAQVLHPALLHHALGHHILQGSCLQNKAIQHIGDTVRERAI